MSTLGKGGYGHVFKVKNIDDNQLYAIKRIQLDCSSASKFQNSSKEIIKEINYLSSFSDLNIVKYHNSWIELNLINLTNKINNEFSEDDEPENISTNESYNYNFTKEKEHLSKSSEKSTLNNDSNIVFLDHSSDEKEKSLSTEIINSLDEKQIFIKSNKNSKQNIKDISVKNMISIDNIIYDINHIEKAYIFIQMELCEMTLGKYIETKNNEYDSFEQKSNEHNTEYIHSFKLLNALLIYQEILSGVKYMHERKIMHRDLKPGNIFLNKVNENYIKNDISTAYLVKLGDFGLATEINTFKKKTIYGEIGEEGIGTSSYSSPEQLKGLPHDEKVT